MPNEFYEVSWGAVLLWCSTITTENTRTLVVHELASGDDHPVSDRGAAPRKTVCSLLFDDFPGEPDSPLDRFLKFKAQVDSGEELLFTHPIDGGYYAKVGEFTYDIDEDGNITNASAEFVANQPIAAMLQPGSGSAPSSGIDAVAARADELNAELESVDIDSEISLAGIDRDFISDGAALPDAWAANPDVTARDILVDVSRVSDQLSTLTSILEDDLALFAAYKGCILYGAAFRAAAIAATSETASTFSIKLGAPTSVLALVTRVYGGAEAEERERQVRSLNDVRTPGGLLSAGTELLMPQKVQSGRA